MAKTNNKDVHRGVVLYLDGKEVANNAKAIRAEMKKVREQIDKMTVGSEEYVRATRKYRELDKILQQHKAQLKAVEAQQQSMLSKGVKWFKDYSLQIAGAVTAITGVAMQINRFRKMAAEQEDAAANLKALTGLDDDNIAWLTKQAETLSTSMDATKLRVRKSAKEILEAYMLVGSAKPELLKDKEALNAVTIEAMRLAEAANMDLREAVNAVTTSLNQYSAGADQAARITNVLAAGSKFGAANVQDQAAAVQKAGVAASSANVPFEQLVGVIEMLGEKGIKAEESGTALKRFFLKLQTDADDTNPAIVGLDKALENLAAKHLSMGELQKMFGDRAINVAKILIDNTEKVKEYTAAVTGTNVATEQAAINSDTTAAKMAQIRNQINLTGQQLAKDLAPFLSKTVGWTRKFVMAMPAMIDFLKKYGIQLALLAAAWNALAIKTAVASAAQKAWNIVTAAGRTIAATFRTVVLAMQVGFLKLTGSTQAATVAMAELNVVMKANVIGVLVTLGIALYEVITRLINRTKQLTKEQKLQRDMQRDIAEAEREGNSQRAEAETKIKQLSAVVHDNNRTLKDRKIALQELKKIVPGYHAELTTEGKLIKDNTTALKDYLDNLKEVAVQQALQSKMTKLVEAELNQQDSRRRRANAERIRRDRLSAFDAEHEDIRQFMEKGLNINYGGGYEFVSEWMKKNDVGRMTAQRQIGELMQQRAHILETIREAEGWVSEADEAIENIQRRQQNLQKQGADIVKTLPGASGTTDTNTVLDRTPKTEAGKEKRIREAIEAVNLEYDARANELKQQYIDGEIETEQEYSKRLQDIELERLNRQLEIAGLEPKQREQFLQKILDMKVKLMDQIRSFDDIELEGEENKLAKMLKANEDAYNRRNGIIKKALDAGVITQEQYRQRLNASFARWQDDDRKAQEQSAHQRLSISRKGLDEALLALRETKMEENLTEEEYNERIFHMKEAFFQKLLEVENLSKEDRADLSRQLKELRVNHEEEADKKIIEKNQQTFETMRAIGSEFADAFGQLTRDLMNEEEEAWTNFGKQIVKTLINTIKKLAIAYIAEVTIKNMAAFSFAGLAKAALEIAAIEAAVAGLNGLLDGWAKGGYTGPGRWDEPRGIVHAGEFVANRYAVANDAVRPVLDLIDQAQKNGSIANLTSEDIAAVAYPSGATAPSPNRTGTPAAGNNPARDPELTKAINLLTRTTARAAEAYQEPSTAFCFLEGRGGINTAQDLLKKMKSNASRKS